MMEDRADAWHRALLVGSVGIISLTAWLALWRFGLTLHGSVHHHDSVSGSIVTLFFVGGWTVMTIAMMLPTSVPLIATFDTIANRRADRTSLVALVVLGYLLVWASLGIALYVVAIVAQRLTDRSAWLQARSTLGAASLFFVAGVYQFSSLKHRCLDKCRSPLSFVLSHWQGDHERRNAIWLGAHHGLFCVGCCWALMMLMFAVGVGNLAWMLVLGAIMAIEKNVSWGGRLSTPLGILLVAGGVMILMTA